MQRWPSPKATKRLRDRVRELTDKRHSGKDVKQIIAKLNPVLRGWGNYFRTGNADREFNQDGQLSFTSGCVRWMHRRGGQRADAAGAVDRRPVSRNGSVSTARNREIPGASHTSKIIGKPCAGKPHARFERGLLKTGWRKPVPRQNLPMP